MDDLAPYTPHDWHWIVGGDESRMWSSKAGTYIKPIKGVAATRISSEEELDDVLATYGLLGPTARPMIRKSTITARLIEAGKMDAAKAALDASPANFGRWIAADRPAIYADDPDALALLNAIGADAAVILAARVTKTTLARLSR